MPTTRTESSSATSRRTTSRADTAARDEIVELLKQDHRKVKKAFRDFEKLDPKDDACQALVKQTLTELEIHAELEEDLFYPAIRSALADEGLIDEAEVEHMTFRVLMDQLKEMSPSDDRYTATFTVLGEYIKHHVKEEESEIFVGLSKARMNWRTLRDDMLQLREQRMAEQGLSPSDAQKGRASTTGDAPH